MSQPKSGSPHSLDVSKQNGTTDSRQVTNSKLYPPPLRSDTVRRRQLTNLIAADPHQRIVVIEAPAGYGKSTLAAQWLAAQKTPVAWVTLDAQDNDPQRFFQLIIDVLRGLGPEIGTEAQEALGRDLPPLGSGLVDELIAALGLLAAPCALVLDDYHVIQDDGLHRSLGEVLRKLPNQMRVLILTRTRLPIPLARLRARGAVLDLGFDDLRFTDSEAGLLLGDDLVLTEADILRLNTRTEGWPAGLRLTWHALHRQPGDRVHTLIEQVAGHHEPLSSFLWEEVLDDLPPSMLDFLTGCAIFDRFCAALCDHSFGKDGSRQRIREVHAANLFVIPLDVEGDWYRFHPLLRDVLQQRWVEGTPAEEQEAIHRLAATWFEAQGLIDEAVQQVVAANDLTHAGALLLPIAEAMYLKDHFASLRIRLADLPPALFEEYPKLSFYLVWALARSGQTRASERALAVAEATWAARPDVVEPGQIAMLKAFQRGIIMSDFGQAIAYIDEALALIPAGRDEERILASIIKAKALLFLGKPREAEAALEAYRGVQLGRALRIVDAGCSGQILVAKGKLNEAVTLFEQASGFGTDAISTLRHPNALSHLGLVHLEHNALDLAEEVLRLGVRLSDEASKHLWRGRLYFGLASVARARGDLAAALRQVEMSIDACEQVGSPYEIQRAQALQARIWIEQGQLPLARRWFKQSGIARIPGRASYEQFSGQLTLVRLLLAEGGQEEAALVHLDLLREAAIADERVGDLIEIDVLRALAYQAQQVMPDALAAMGSALELAEPGGYVRVFVDEAAGVIPLLRRLGGQGRFRAYAAQLLEAIRQPVDPDQSQLQRPLSKREVEVTRLIGVGFSSQEIANELFIAETTVRKHVTRIFSKLQVSNRVQAVNLAREYGLIDE